MYIQILLLHLNIKIININADVVNHKVRLYCNESHSSN